MSFVEVSERGWGCLLTLARPPVNALGLELMTELEATLERLHAAPPPVVVLTGAGHCFTGGADLKEAQRSMQSLRDRHARGRRVTRLLKEAPFPVIAAINGPCLGSGMNLAANSDVRIARETATFGIPEVKRGRSGGAAALRGLIPEGFVRWLAFTGDALDAATALRIGLVQQVVDAASWEAAVESLAGRIAANGATALFAVKESLEQSHSDAPAHAYWVEQQLSFRLWAMGQRHTWDNGSPPESAPATVDIGVDTVEGAP